MRIVDGKEDERLAAEVSRREDGNRLVVDWL